MEGIVYLLVRMACIFYLLYKVWCWKSRVDEICRLLYGKGAETGAEALVEYPKDTGTEDVMGSTRFVYLDEDAGTGVAPYMSQPLEMSADYIGEEDEIQDGEVECNLSLEEMELLRKEQEELDGLAPEAVAVTQAVTADDLSLAGDVLMKVDGADRDVEKVCRAARTVAPAFSTCLFPRRGIWRPSPGCWRRIWMKTGSRWRGKGKRGSLTGKRWSDPRAWMNEGLCMR